MRLVGEGKMQVIMDDDNNTYVRIVFDEHGLCGWGTLTDGEITMVDEEIAQWNEKNFLNRSIVNAIQ